MCSISRYCHLVSPSGAIHSHSHEECVKIPVAPYTILGVICFSHFSHSHECVMVSPLTLICISLWLMVLSLFIFIDNINTVFCEVPLHIFCKMPGVLEVCGSFLCILDINSCQICIITVFSHLLGSFFYFSNVVF